MKRKTISILILLLAPFVIKAQMEFLRHDGYYSFKDISAGKSINFFVEEAGISYWVDGPEKFPQNPKWFKNQNVNKSEIVVKKNKIQITVKQPNNVVIKGKGKIWYGEIEFKLKFYRGDKKVNTKWLKMNFVPFKE